MSTTSVTITVNKPDGREIELNAACGPSFAHIGKAVEMALEVNGFKDGDWSSLVVTIVPESAPGRKPLRPTLAVVR